MNEQNDLTTALDAFERSAVNFFHQVQVSSNQQPFDMSIIFGGYQLLMLRLTDKLREYLADSIKSRLITPVKELHTAHTDIKRLINELNHNENEVALDHFFQHLTQHGNDNAPECSQATSKQSENVRLLTTQDSNISHMDIDMHSLASTPVPTTVSASSLATAPAPAPMHIDLASTSMDISAMSTPRKRKNADINPNGDGNSLKKLRLRSATPHSDNNNNNNNNTSMQSTTCLPKDEPMSSNNLGVNPGQLSAKMATMLRDRSGRFTAHTKSSSSKSALITGACFFCCGAQRAFAIDDWQIHLLKHTNEKASFCRRCHVQFDGDRPEPSASCEHSDGDCNETFAETGYKSELRGFLCIECNLVHMIEHSMQQHMSSMHPSALSNYELVSFVPDLSRLPASHIFENTIYCGNRGLYKCGVDECQVQLSNRSELDDHLTGHKIIKATFKCPHCSHQKCVKTKTDVLDHICSHCGSSFRCCICKFRTTYDRAILAHMIQKHANISGSVLRFESNHRHSQTRKTFGSHELVMKCRPCNKRFPSIDCANEHVNDVHRSRNIQLSLIEWIRETQSSGPTTHRMSEWYLPAMKKFYCKRPHDTKVKARRANRLNTDAIGCHSNGGNRRNSQDSSSDSESDDEEEDDDAGFSTKEAILQHYEDEHYYEAALLLEIKEKWQFKEEMTDCKKPTIETLDDDLLFVCVHCYKSSRTQALHYETVTKVHEHWLYQHTTSTGSDLPFQFYVTELIKCSLCMLTTTYTELRDHHKRAHSGEPLKIDGVGWGNGYNEKFIRKNFYPKMLNQQLLDYLCNIDVHSQFKCVECDAIFDTEQFFDAHHRVEHEKFGLMKNSRRIAGFELEYCNLLCCKSKERCAPMDLINHIRTVCHEYKCKNCNYQSSDAYKIAEHFTERHDATKNVKDYYVDSMKCIFWQTEFVFGNGFVATKYNLKNSKHFDLDLFERFLSNRAIIGKRRSEDGEDFSS